MWMGARIQEMFLSASAKRLQALRSLSASSGFLEEHRSLRCVRSRVLVLGSLANTGVTTSKQKTSDRRTTSWSGPARAVPSVMKSEARGGWLGPLRLIVRRVHYGASFRSI